MSNQDDQIAELNERVKTYLAPSKVQGVGVFALRDIFEGQKLYSDHMPTVYTVPYSSFDKLFPEVKKYLLERWPLITSGSRFAYPTERIQAFMNHLDIPNYDAINDIMLKDVKAHEEIFEDYRVIFGWEEVHTWLVDKKNDIIETNV